MIRQETRTDPARARKLAEQCFKVARSTTFDGERTAAITRGEAIATRAGLSLDSFDIPGRVKPKPEPQYNRPDDIAEMLRRAKGTRDDWGRDDWYASARKGAFADLAATMRRKAAEAGARPGETVYEARRRAFEEATATPDSELHRRIDLATRWPSIDAVLNALRARRIAVMPADDRTEQGLRSIRPIRQRWVASMDGFVVLDEWSLRELADEVCA